MSSTTTHAFKRWKPPHGRNVEFVVVRTVHGIYHVTRCEGARIAERMDRWWVPRWLDFTDVHGSIIRVRSGHVFAMFDTSFAMRFSERALTLMLEREEARHLERLSTMLEADPNTEREEE